MAHPSRLEIIKTNPIGERLNAFRETFEATCKDLGLPSTLDALRQIDSEGNVHPQVIGSFNSL